MKSPREWAEACEMGSGEYTDLVLDVRAEFAREAVTAIYAAGATIDLCRIVEALARPQAQPMTADLAATTPAQSLAALAEKVRNAYRCCDLASRGHRDGCPGKSAACKHDLGGNNSYGRWACTKCGDRIGP